eukprot:185538-Prymnesium_polylepis.1
MFKRKASAAEQAEAKAEEQVDIAFMHLQGGFTSTSEEHQANPNRSRMVLQATDFAAYDRLKKGSIPSRRKEFSYLVAVYQRSVAEKILNRKVDEEESEAEAKVTKVTMVGGVRTHQ